MSTWQIYSQTSNLGWDLDTPINRPNQDMETKYISTMTTIRLADGSTAYVTPETKRLKEPFTMFWADASDSFRTQIENYILNGDTVKIETHTSDIFIGRFMDMSRVWFSGLDDTYDIQVTFVRTQ